MVSTDLQTHMVSLSEMQNNSLKTEPIREDTSGMSHKLKVQYWPIDDVHPYPNNPRNNDEAVEYVANSIREFGWQQPIVVDTDGTIIAGHTRLKAAKRLGMDTVPVVVADNLTPAQVNAYRLADNKVAEAATWDMEALSVELEGLEVDFDMTMFDFDLGSNDWFSDRQRNDTSHQEGNDEYNDFLDKFEVKKTTDDCYTPDLVYDAVLDWVRNEYGISEDAQIVRPFYPNGDYEHEDYPEGCVVVDNPPFSILSEILRFYVDSSVKFFLFAPALTLFSPRVDCCRIPTGVSITYENGANVSTSFMTNLDTDNAIRTAPDLYKTVDSANKQNREELAKPVNLKYKYPSHVITSAMVSCWCELGVEFAVPKGNEYQVGCLDAQKEYDKGIFGSGFLLSDECARDAERAKADAERAKALEAAKALGDGVEVEPDGSVVWRLSERELAIVEGLGK